MSFDFSTSACRGHDGFHYSAEITDINFRIYLFPVCTYLLFNRKSILIDPVAEIFNITRTHFALEGFIK